MRVSLWRAYRNSLHIHIMVRPILVCRLIIAGVPSLQVVSTWGCSRGASLLRSWPSGALVSWLRWRPVAWAWVRALSMLQCWLFGLNVLGAAASDRSFWKMWFGLSYSWDVSMNTYQLVSCKPSFWAASPSGKNGVNSTAGLLLEDLSEAASGTSKFLRWTTCLSVTKICSANYCQPPMTERLRSNYTWCGINV